MVVVLPSGWCCRCICGTARAAIEVRLPRHARLYAYGTVPRVFAVWRRDGGGVLVRDAHTHRRRAARVRARVRARTQARAGCAEGWEGGEVPSRSPVLGTSGGGGSRGHGDPLGPR